MRALLIVLFLINFGIINCQEQQEYFRVYTNVLHNVDISHPRANIGIEKDFKNNHSISLGLGIYYHNWFFDDFSNGMSISFEFKKLRWL